MTNKIEVWEKIVPDSIHNPVVVSENDEMNQGSAGLGALSGI